MYRECFLYVQQTYLARGRSRGAQEEGGEGEEEEEQSELAGVVGRGLSQVTRAALPRPWGPKVPN
jgi:hypothetical protein